MSANFGYPIRAASRMTGISVDSIRAWERRYTAIKPRRSKGGRLYSEEDVIRLKLLKRAVDNGHSIGQIANLPNEDLERLPLSKHGDVTNVPGVEKTDSKRDLRAIMASIDEYDATKADRILGKLASLLTPREFVHGAVIPLMQHVGEAWKEGTLNVAQEHMISSIMRNILGALVRLHAKENHKTKLIFATPTDESHEFGILISAMLSVAGSIGVVYLGPNLPEAEIIRAAKKTKAKAVVMAIVADKENSEQRLDSIRQVREGISAGADLLVGGKLTPSMRVFLAENDAHYIQSFEHFEEFIEQYGAKF